MSDKFFYQTTYTLDKTYYQECFDQSSKIRADLQDYYKAIALCAVGGLLVLFTELNPYAAWFLFVLGIIEALSVRFKKPWWVARQMLSRAANHNVQLTIDKHGFTTTLMGEKQHISWHDIVDLTHTEKGWLLSTKKGKSYISQGVLSEDASCYLNKKAVTINSNI